MSFLLNDLREVCSEPRAFTWTFPAKTSLLIIMKIIFLSHGLMKARQQKILLFIKKHQFHPSKNIDQLKC